MVTIKAVIDLLVTQDYFIIILIILIMILVVLIMALYKTQKRYKEIIDEEEAFSDIKNSEVNDMFNELKDEDDSIDKIENIDSNEFASEEKTSFDFGMKSPINMFDLSDEDTAIISNDALDKLENKEAIVEQFEKY